MHPPEVKSFSPDVVHEPMGSGLEQLPPVVLSVTTLPSPHFMLVVAAKAGGIAKPKINAATNVSVDFSIVSSLTTVCA
jgi:hypothetical protein